MPLLSAKDRQFLQNHFGQALVKPVKLVFFTQQIACQYCRETRQILEEVAGLSDKITVDIHNFITDKEVADRYGIDKIPATVVMADTDYGIRFYGIPSGYEFTTLIEDIVDVSRGKTELMPETIKVLADIEEPVHIQVFVTPPCPYCPSAVRLAHSLAIASEKVRADMVEAIEFPQLSSKYSVYGVPRTVINEDTHMEGAAPEPLLVAKVQEALALLTSEQVDQLMQEMIARGQEMQEQPLEGEEQ